jgi:F-type H+-transporting ATPase subunit delta
MSTETSSTGPVAETYGRALFELAKEADQADRVLEDLRELVQVFRDNPQLFSLLVNRTIDPVRREKTLNAVFSGRLSDLLLKFLLVLNKKQRFPEFTSIVLAYDRMLKASRGQVDVQVITARPLDAAQMSAVTDRISTAIGKKAVVHPKVDPSLIGGLKVRVGDKLIDGSVASRLRKLSRNLVDSGHDKLRARSASIVQ